MDQKLYPPTVANHSIAGAALARTLLLGLFAALLLGGSIIWLRPLRRSTSTPPPALPDSPASLTTQEQPVDELSAAVVKEPPTNTLPHEKSYLIASRPAASLDPVQAAATAALPPTAAYSQQLIQRLAQVDPNQPKITPEQAAEMKQNLKTLVGQGAAAVPAIRQFLESSQDVSFENPNGSNEVGYSSLRAGLFEALKQIGGPEATDTFVRTLRSTADPSEIASIAKYLEEQAPGQYRAEAVSAARETLDQAARGQLQVRDAGALFQVLQNYGDANLIPDLEKSMPQWHYYATMALAGLPDGQGVAALSQRVQDATAAGKTANIFDLQMLAQSAGQSPEATSALVEQTKKNQIPDRAWTKIVEGLAGDQYQIGKAPTDPTNPNVPPTGLKTYHIESGNQNFYSLPFNASGSPEQAAQRRAVVDQLLAATQNPAALQALQRAQAALSAPVP
jgi:hypothetical protein